MFSGLVKIRWKEINARAITQGNTVYIYIHIYIHIRIYIHTHTHIYTVDGERFAGLNIRGFSAIEDFTEIFSHYLGHKYSLFSINKERHIYSWKNFHGTPENCENCKSLAQQIFPVYGIYMVYMPHTLELTLLLLWGI